MQIEYIAGVRFTSWRSFQQQREGTVSHGVLGQVVVYHEDVLALVHEVLAHGAAGIGRDVLKRRKLGSGSGNDDGIIQCAACAELLNNAGNSGVLLTYCDIDADNVLALLVDDGVDSDGSLTGLAVADDKLTLTSAYRDHAVYCLDTGLERHGNRLSGDDTRRDLFNGACFLREDSALAVDGLSQGIHNSAQERFADRHGHDAACALYGGAFLDILVGAEHNRANEILLEVHRHALHAVLEFEKLVEHALLKSVDTHDTVAYCDNGADVSQLELRVVVLYPGLYQTRYFIGA